MILQKTELNTNFANLSNTQLTEAIGECFEMMEVLIRSDSVLVSEDVYKLQDPGVTDFAYLQLDTIEELVYINYPENMVIFAEGFCSKFSVVNRRARDVVYFYQSVKEYTRSLTNAYIPLTAEETLKLRELVKELLGHISYFLYYQFKLDETLTCYLEGNEIEVDYNISKFCDAKGIDVAVFIQIVKGVMQTHRPSLPVFDEYPELEESFYDIVGAYVQDFDALESNLTIDIVKQVLKEDCDMEKLLASLQPKEE